MEHATTGQPSLAELFRNRNFSKFWIGQLISYLGDRIDQMAMIGVLSVGVSKEIASDRANLITFWATLAYVVFGPFAGPIIDRFDRRRLMILMDILRAGVVLALPFCISPSHHPGVIYAIVFLIGLATSVFAPAKSAFIPEIVPQEHLLRANSVTSTMGTLTVLFGTVIGGALVSALNQPNWFVDQLGWLFPREKMPPGLGFAFLIDALTYLVSALLLFWIVVPRAVAGYEEERRRRVRAEGSFWGQLQDGIRYLTHHRLPATAALIQSWFFFVGGAYFTIVTKLVYLRLSPSNEQATEYLGYAYGALGVGLVCGGLLTGIYGGRLSLRWLVTGCFAVASFTVATLTLPLPPWSLYLVNLVVGYVGGGVAVCMDTLLQRVVPDEYRGRVFALTNLLLNSLLLISIWLGANYLGSTPTSIHYFTLVTAIGVLLGVPIAWFGFPARLRITQVETQS
ncbi:MAG: MFS transporter [Candidatus Sumerlaea sp.]|nr:MAG: MFS transporter [Candidatus Sumerlaea sp.]